MDTVSDNMKSTDNFNIQSGKSCQRIIVVNVGRDSDFNLGQEICTLHLAINDLPKKQNITHFHDAEREMEGDVLWRCRQRKPTGRHIQARPQVWGWGCLGVWWCWPAAVDRRCRASNLIREPIEYGNHTGLAYSAMGIRN
ncbi:hypothetical protein J6590_042635 [Homalodisca vitripennis]|nr:hypothetical protein J6590_042635 [Homalodisca vitripennis]